jgi:hypothetical protein
VWWLRFVPDQARGISQRWIGRSDRLRRQVKRFFGIFVLTPAEQRLVIFVVLLLVAGAWYKYHRDSNFTIGPQPTPTASPLPNKQ